MNSKDNQNIDNVNGSFVRASPLNSDISENSVIKPDISETPYPLKYREDAENFLYTERRKNLSYPEAEKSSSALESGQVIENNPTESFLHRANNKLENVSTTLHNLNTSFKNIQEISYSTYRIGHWTFDKSYQVGTFTVKKTVKASIWGKNKIIKAGEWGFSKGKTGCHKVRKLLGNRSYSHENRNNLPSSEIRDFNTSLVELEIDQDQKTILIDSSENLKEESMILADFHPPQTNEYYYTIDPYPVPQIDTSFSSNSSFLSGIDILFLGLPLTVFYFFKKYEKRGKDKSRSKIVYYKANLPQLRLLKNDQQFYVENDFLVTDHTDEQAPYLLKKGFIGSLIKVLDYKTGILKFNLPIFDGEYKAVQYQLWEQVVLEKKSQNSVILRFVRS